MLFLPANHGDKIGIATFDGVTSAASGPGKFPTLPVGGKPPLTLNASCAVPGVASAMRSSRLSSLWCREQTGCILLRADACECPKPQGVEMGLTVTPLVRVPLGSEGGGFAFSASVGCPEGR